MKLDRLTSTTRSRPREAPEHVREATEETRLRVAAMEGVDADRERSLQQELDAGKATFASVDPEAGHVLQEAREVAEQLVQLGGGAAQLIKAAPGNPLSPGVDTEA